MVTKPSKYPDIWILKELKDWLKKVKDDKDIIFIKELCNDKRYSYDDINQAIQYNKDKSPIYSEISTTYKRVKQIIEQRVYKGALEGKFNANIAQLGLKYNHNWKDKQDIDMNVKGDIDLGGVLKRTKEENKE